MTEDVEVRWRDSSHEVFCDVCGWMGAVEKCTRDEVDRLMCYRCEGVLLDYFQQHYPGEWLGKEMP